MRISFDLDQTLICPHPEVPREAALSWLDRLLTGDEPLRLGTRALAHRLKAHGWDLWIYTTSMRKQGAVRQWLRQHGVHVSEVINQRVHDAHLRHSPSDHPPSKNPAAFGIDLHVDDSEGVRMEGLRHGFDVVIVEPFDTSWADCVWRAAERIQARKHPGLKKTLERRERCWAQG